MFTRNLILLTALALSVLPARAAEEEPAPLVPDVVDFAKLLPFLPEPPAEWTADKPEGSTVDNAGFKVSTVHRDYQKGNGEKAPTTSVSILDSAANPDFVSATTAGWNLSATTTEGYTKSLKIDDMPGFETFENEGKHATLWLMVAKRYVLQIETTGLDPKELQDWLKRIDLKKLSAIK